jgi:glycosyltransferase involved in cell wall biosynthesis
MRNGFTHNCLPNYILITPARNEAIFIEDTIKSVINQTVLPKKWIIISDGSTDGTDDIVKRYETRYKWIELLRMPERDERHFGGKVNAFNAGYDKVKGMDYEIIGNLDAAITIDNDHLSYVLEKFAEKPKLGIGGTPFVEDTRHYDYRFTSIEHVSGACQLFRKECFQDIGGFVPIKEGGEDLIAGISARMKGWQSRTFTEKLCIHNRKSKTQMHSGLQLALRNGYHDYLMGGHPLWQLFRSIYQMKKSPFIISGCLIFIGYLWGMMKQPKRPVSKKVVAFRRKEQISRLRIILTELLGIKQNSKF